MITHLKAFFTTIGVFAGAFALCGLIILTQSLVNWLDAIDPELPFKVGLSIIFVGLFVSVYLVSWLCYQYKLR